MGSKQRRWVLWFCLGNNLSFEVTRWFTESRMHYKDGQVETGDLEGGKGSVKFRDRKDLTASSIIPEHWG